VQFAQAVDDHFVGLAVGVPAEGGVFLGHLRQHAGDLLLVAAGIGGDGQAVHRRGEVQRLEMHAVERMVVVQDVAGVDFFDLGDGADVAGDDLRGLRGVPCPGGGRRGRA
jgi:hypothetical protein